MIILLTLFVFFRLQEKAALGVTMALGIVAVPAWVLANLKHYRGA